MNAQYTCLNSVLEDIYSSENLEYLENSGDKFIEGFQRFGDRNSLLKILRESFVLWEKASHMTNEKTNRVNLHYHAAWCFYYVYKMLSSMKDPSIIPEIIQYFPCSTERGYMYNLCDDMLTQSMMETITDYQNFGPEYVSWLIRSLHLIPKGIDQEVFLSEMMSCMMSDTFDRIIPDKLPENLLLVEALPLGNRKILIDLLQCMRKRYKIYIQEETVQRILLIWKKYLVWTEYVLGQLLALPENVVPLHVLD